MFVRCATVSSPQGGPRDSVPPVFRGSSPEPYSTGFRGKKLTLTFNENVVLKEQQKYFFMSPPKTKKPSMLAKGKSIVVEFEEPLDTATTYSLDFGAAITDATEGNKVAAFNFVFSTGDHVDSLVMNGQVLSAFTRDSVIGAFIFFFDASQYDSTKLDSVMWNGHADAMFRSDSSGFFIADILKDKDYRIYAMYDVNGNQLYEAGTDYIGFLDRSYNPTRVGGFTMVYDSLIRRWSVDSLQTNFELFLEQPKKKQLLLSNKRPKQNLVVLSLNEKHAVIDTLDFAGIPASWQRRPWSRNRDTLSIWINPPTAEQRIALPDTLKARLVYERTDSVWNMYPYGQNLRLSWKPYVPRKMKKSSKEDLTLGQKIKKLFTKKHRRTKKMATDSVRLARYIADSMARDSIRKKEVEDSIKQATRLKISVNATSQFVPLTDLIFTFESPLDSLVTDGIQMWKLPQVIKKGKVVEERRTAKEAGSPVPFEVFRDSIDILKVHIKSDWQPGDKFSIMIPSGAFKTIMGEKNDTLNSDFVVASPSKYGTIVLKSVSLPENVRPETRYIYQIIEKATMAKDAFTEAKIVRQLDGVIPGQEVKIEYIEPSEKYQLRIIEDYNGNGMWDTGVLETHTKPEKVRILTQKNSENPILVIKENWTVEFEVDYKNLFK